MTTAIPSGLGATWGITQEGTVGTFTTSSMRWIPVLSDKVVGSKITAQGQALHGGLYELGSHRRLVGYDVKGAVEVDLQDRSLGLVIQNMLGSAAPGVAQIGATGFYAQPYTPGDLTGMSLSLQSGRPTTLASIQQFNYAGCKILGWELAAQVNELAKLTLDIDGWSEDTTAGYAAPTAYLKTNVLAFVDGYLSLGGTVGSPSTTFGGTTGTLASLSGSLTLSAANTKWGFPNGQAVSASNPGWGTIVTTGTGAGTHYFTYTGYTSGGPTLTGVVFDGGASSTATNGTSVVTGGVVYGAATTAPAATVKSISLKGENGANVDRRNIGSPTKREQLANAFRKYTGTFDIEFTNLTDYYNAYNADTATALQLNFAINPNVSSAYSALYITIPQVRLNMGTPATDGPELLQVQVPFDVLDNGTNPAIQMTYITQDATV